MRIIKNEVTSWQPFWFLHTCINCVDVQLTLCKGTIFYGTCKTPLIFFLATVKTIFRFHIPVTKAVQSLYESKQRSGRIETDCYENSQKGLHTGITVWYRAGDDFVPKSKRGSFSRRQTPSPLKTVCGWRTQTSSLYADSLNARSLYKCVKTGKWNLHPLPRALPTLLYSRSNTCSISLLLYKTLPPST